MVIKTIALARAAKSGDQTAYEKLIAIFLPRIAALKSRFPGIPHLEAEDIILEIFPRIFARLEELKNPECFDAYVLRAAMNRIIEHYRSEQLKRAVEENYQIFLQDLFDLPGGLLSNLERTADIEAAVDSLPVHFRAVYILRFREYFNITEICTMLQITPHAAKKRLQKAKKLIEKFLKKDG